MSGILWPFKWFYREFGVASIHETGRNAYLIIFARTCRMFAYGTNSLILAIFFSALGFSDNRIGIFMTLTLLGDVFLGTFLTLIADRVGRRKVLLAGSFLMIMSGVMFAVLENFWLLLLAAIVGVISITGGDFGPFRSIEESILSHLTTPATRSDVLAWCITISALGSSIGTEASGRIIKALQAREGWRPVDAYHALFWVYALMGIVNAVLVMMLTDECETKSNREAYAQVPQSEDATVHRNAGIHADSGPEQLQGWGKRAKTWLSNNLSEISGPTRSIMYKLWFLLAADSLADGMVPWSLTNYYMDIKFHPEKSTLGDITSVSYFLAAIGAAFAGPLARKIGLINTMVFTHVPSSVAVLIFPISPVLWVAACLLFVRAGLNNMDQAPRAAFIAGVVKPEERTAVMGITAMLRTVSAMGGPIFTGALAAGDKFWIAYVVAGALRLAYDFGLYALFVNTKLHQHEMVPEMTVDGPEGRLSFDDEEAVLEMQSLASSDSDFDGKDDQKPLRVVDDR